MKRIVFYLNQSPDANEFQMFRDSFDKEGVRVEYCMSDAPVIDEFDSLVCTDDSNLYHKLKKSDKEPLAVVYNIDETDKFQGARYFVLNPFEAECDYYLKIWQRLRNIPWVIARTKSLILRETVEDDIDIFAKFYNNPEMTRYTDAVYNDVEKEKEYLKEYRRSVYEMNGFGIWTVVRRSDNSVIGRAGFSIRAGFDGAEIGYAIAPEYLNHGYATEAIGECIALAKEMRLEPIHAFVAAPNEASKRVLEKCGMHSTKELVWGIMDSPLERWEI